MQFNPHPFATYHLVKTVILVGRFLPINIIKGISLLMATAIGDVPNVRKLCQKVRSSNLPLSLQHAILNESVSNILLLDKWQQKKGVNRPQQREALQTFDNVSSVVWDITVEDTRIFFNQLVHTDYFIPESVDIGSVVFKLCTRQNWSTEHKQIAFSLLCHQVANSKMGIYGLTHEHVPLWALSDIYQNWKFDLNADALVPSLPSERYYLSRASIIPSLTLLENCVVGAPDNVLIDMVQNCISQETLNTCSNIFERPNLSEDLLYVFFKKGMDVRTVLENKFGHRNRSATMMDLENELADYSSQVLDTLKNVQLRVAAEHQSSVLVEAVKENTQRESVQTLSLRRKI